ncbi:homocitrate synthase [Xylaria bambusicola]|uniref:homocitrate synthase n=1 Tax=Xylaria bambusicola TaxID=326684 RepID=UPI00200759D6|nr:homocitrate synthase [Xylaria bambusicola]KAI0514697.1 homocitrate synthase [Xylaria bambusicola]
MTVRMNGESNGATHGPTNGTTNGTHPVQRLPKSSPYQSYQDCFSNVAKYKIIDSTLREGEQFSKAYFTSEDKIKIAKALDSFGVDYIELTNPCSSPQSFEDCKRIASLGLKAVETGVDGVNLVIGTSSFLREFSHGKSMEMIQKTALEVIAYVKSQGVEVRFSSEDSFRSDLVDLLVLYQAVDKAGVNRVGIADTVGGATARMVYDLVRRLRGVVHCDIECHFHDDTGTCFGQNAHSALEAGATHIDTSVLGIGDNGITPLGSLMARMIVTAPEYTKAKYNLMELKALETLVADIVQITIPYNNCAFTHKAGIHAKAILNNPSTYEIINPEDFGLSRYVCINSRITGWNAVRSRADQLGLYNMSDDQIKQVTAKIKKLADIRPLGIEDTDSLLRSFHLELQAAA